MSAVNRVIVLGGGVAAGMAALAITRALGRLGVEVTWVARGETPAQAALVALPDVVAFHRLLGISEADLLRGASATLTLGQQFAGWSGNAPPFVLAWGDAGASFGGLPFVQYWVRARHAGLQVPLEDFCLAAAAAKQGRVGEGGQSKQAVKPGLQLDAAGYARLLRAACVAAGVRIVDGAGARPEFAAGRVCGLRLADGTLLQADLFVDAEGALIGGLQAAEPGTARCDRMRRATAPALEPKPLIGRVLAHPAGWLTLMPLADRTALEFAWDSTRMTDAEALAALSAGTRLSAVGEPEALGAAFRPRPWVANVVAVGPAAGDAPPLDGAELLLLQLAVAQLVLLWPLDEAHMPEAEIYNSEMRGSRARATDFTAMHFRLNRRSEPFWQAARAAPVSPELDGKIRLFAARGMFAHFNHEPHVEDGWALAMAGHGLLPASPDPMVWRVEDAGLMAEFRRQLGAIAADVRAMPTHAEALTRMTA